MSDFGNLMAYALELEASVPEAAMAKLEAVRPTSMPPTKRQREEAEKLAAMSPEDRTKAQEEIARKREEARAKAEEETRHRTEQAAKEAAAKAHQQEAPKPAAPAPAPAQHAAPATPR
jgi:phenylalanyl-tRNA synthetase alpha subunit